VTGAYNSGAYYPVGGPARFAQTLLPTILTAGGECRVAATARRILTTDGRAVGVEVLQGQAVTTEHSKQGISDIGLANTLACLDTSCAQRAGPCTAFRCPSSPTAAMLCGRAHRYRVYCLQVRT
jgi:all-trans-retinol 13,14-reductase